MRIIGGTLKGLRFYPPSHLPVRPTTDLAKEALFNILNNRLDFEGIKVLDLFSGTGNISIEFASRGAQDVVAIDKNTGCVNYLKSLSNQHKLDNIHIMKADVFKFLRDERHTYDLIFADPPYDLAQIPSLIEIVFERQLLVDEGLLIIEHQSNKKLDNHPRFTEFRKYGNSSFSFFE